MLVHVAVLSKLASAEGVLTYRADEAAVGEVVVVAVRGRRVPGLIVATDVPAGTSRHILPVLAQSGKQLPTSFLKSLAQIGDYYVWPLSPTLAQLGANLNARYATPPQIDTPPGPQRLFLTPSLGTPLAHHLHTQAEVVAEDASTRRLQWWRAASGQAMTVVGTSAALLLPYANLYEITLETPFASPYYQDRAPGFNTAVLACLIAHATGAHLTIRTGLPREVLASRFPLPPDTTLAAPTLHPLTHRPLGDRPLINHDLLNELRHNLEDNHRTLIFYNHLPHVDPLTGKSLGLTPFVNRLTKELGDVVGVVTARQELPREPIVVATATTLYRLTDQFDRIIVPLGEALISSRQPWSPAAAIDTLVTLASRAPLTVQTRDSDSLIAAACVANFNPSAALPWPLFSSRLLRTTAQIAVPDSWQRVPVEEDEQTYIVPRQLDRASRETIAQARQHGKIWTDEWLWPA